MLNFMKIQKQLIFNSFETVFNFFNYRYSKTVIIFVNFVLISSADFSFFFRNFFMWYAFQTSFVFKSQFFSSFSFEHFLFDKNKYYKNV